MALNLKQVEKRKKKINQKPLPQSPNSVDINFKLKTDKLDDKIKPWSKELIASEPVKEIPIENKTSKSTAFKFKIPVPRIFHQKSK